MDAEFGRLNVIIMQNLAIADAARALWAAMSATPPPSFP